MRREPALIDACVRYLKLQGCLAWRSNTGMMRQDAPGRRSRFIRFGFIGQPDILGCTSEGRFVAVECKTGDVPVTPAQQLFLDEVASRGGLALVVRDSVEALVHAWTIA